jgi:hypothetical protein
MAGSTVTFFPIVTFALIVRSRSLAAWSLPPNHSEPWPPLKSRVIAICDFVTRSLYFPHGRLCVLSLPSSSRGEHRVVLGLLGGDRRAPQDPGSIGARGGPEREREGGFGGGHRGGSGSDTSSGLLPASKQRSDAAGPPSCSKIEGGKQREGLTIERMFDSVGSLLPRDRTRSRCPRQIHTAP